MKAIGSILWLALAAAPLAGVAPAQAQAQQPQAAVVERAEPLLTVTGEGVVRGRPDMAIIGVGVVSEARSAREALADNSQAISRMITALRDEGLESRDLQTTGIYLEPIYTQPPPNYDGSQPFTPQIVGYRVRNELSVRVREINRTGSLLDQVVQLGANSISGPTFGVADPSPFEDQARRAAMRNALRKGQLYADAADVRLGRIVRIDESSFQAPQPIPMAAMARESAQDAAVPIEGGELTFQAQVTVAWRIGG